MRQYDQPCPPVHAEQDNQNRRYTTCSLDCFNSYRVTIACRARKHCGDGQHDYRQQSNRREQMILHRVKQVTMQQRQHAARKTTAGTWNAKQLGDRALDSHPPCLSDRKLKRTSHKQRTMHDRIADDWPENGSIHPAANRMLRRSHRITSLRSSPGRPGMGGGLRGSLRCRLRSGSSPGWGSALLAMR